MKNKSKCPEKKTRKQDNMIDWILPEATAELEQFKFEELSIEETGQLPDNFLKAGHIFLNLYLRWPLNWTNGNTLWKKR